MVDVKSKGWWKLPRSCKTSGRSHSMSLLRRSSSWRRPGERDYNEAPVVQGIEPTQRARPQSCIEGAGRMDKWLQTLERVQSQRAQKTIPTSVKRIESVPTLLNNLCSNPKRMHQSSRISSGAFESTYRSTESVVHGIQSVSGSNETYSCSPASVRFGWLPVESHVSLIQGSQTQHNISRCQKLKTPITPVLLGSPVELKGAKTKDREKGGFRFWRNQKTPTVFNQSAGSGSSAGGQNGPQVSNPKACNVDRAQTHPETLKNPPQRRGSDPESFSSSISSITITSRKFSDTASPPNEVAVEQRKAIVVKVTNQFTKSSSQPTECNNEERGHGIMLKRKATIIKMTEQREQYSQVKPNTAQNRHSYSEGLKNASVNQSNATSALLKHPPAASVESGGSQWRSTLSLHLTSQSAQSDSKTCRIAQRPLSCFANMNSDRESNNKSANADPENRYRNAPSDLKICYKNTNVDSESHYKIAYVDRDFHYRSTNSDPYIQHQISNTDKKISSKSDNIHSDVQNKSGKVDTSIQYKNSDANTQIHYKCFDADPEFHNRGVSTEKETSYRSIRANSESHQNAAYLDPEFHYWSANTDPEIQYKRADRNQSIPKKSADAIKGIHSKRINADQDIHGTSTNEDPFIHYRIINKDPKIYESINRDPEIDQKSANVDVHFQCKTTNRVPEIPHKSIPDIQCKSSAETQKADTECVSSSRSDARSSPGSRNKSEPVTGNKAPLKLLKMEDNCAGVSADVVLALNAAAIIANIKQQMQKRQDSEHTASSSGSGPEHQTLHTASSSDSGEEREFEEEAADADRKANPHPGTAPFQMPTFPPEPLPY